MAIDPITLLLGLGGASLLGGGNSGLSDEQKYLLGVQGDILSTQRDLLQSRARNESENMPQVLSTIFQAVNNQLGRPRAQVLGPNFQPRLQQRGTTTPLNLNWKPYTGTTNYTPQPVENDSKKPPPTTFGNQAWTYADYLKNLVGPNAWRGPSTDPRTGGEGDRRLFIQQIGKWGEDQGGEGSRADFLKYIAQLNGQRTDDGTSTGGEGNRADFLKYIAQLNGQRTDDGTSTGGEGNRADFLKYIAQMGSPSTDPTKTGGEGNRSDFLKYVAAMAPPTTDPRTGGEGNRADFIASAARLNTTPETTDQVNARILADLGSQWGLSGYDVRQIIASTMERGGKAADILYNIRFQGLMRQGAARGIPQQNLVQWAMGQMQQFNTTGGNPGLLSGTGG